MMALSFIDQCLNGDVDPDAIDDFIDAWHGGAGGDEELYRYLGLAEDEYALWVERPESIHAILAAHRFGLPLDEAIRDTSELGLAARAPSASEADAVRRWLKAKGKL